MNKKVYKVEFEAGGLKLTSNQVFDTAEQAERAALSFGQAIESSASLTGAIVPVPAIQPRIYAYFEVPFHEQELTMDGFKDTEDREPALPFVCDGFGEDVTRVELESYAKAIRTMYPNVEVDVV